MDEQQPAEIAEKKPKRRGFRKLWLWVGAGCLMVALIAGGIVFRKVRHEGSPPKSIVSSMHFPLYYPSPLPVGYKYKPNSAKNESGILFFTLQDGSKTINISEQAIPANPPDLNHLTGFTSLNTLAGSAAIGSNLGQPIAIVLSNTTLIMVNAQHTVPNDTVANVAKSLTSLPQ